MFLKTVIVNPSQFLLVFAFIAFLGIYSCAPKDIYEGVYKAEEMTSQKCYNSQIELMEKGMAIWRTSEDEVSFRWDIKDGEIWLSSKSGGIIIGNFKDDMIEVKLPGAKIACCFKKVPAE